ncbi:GNAT family N-acetyltransferase [Sandarakinorhabdus rubra]|uniref:GNAT family N-acetyltransferase n=1 Tax=Sandarakinorhabdus rubra TaxID=2672568 RepID=UPI0013DAE1F4|nr:GNAT family N-acetyltransferase [Sandarakinorhabdus rubra]
MEFRPALAADAPAIAALHAASWASAYRHILSPDWLDRELAGDRLAVWESRMAAPDPMMRVLLAEDAVGSDTGLAGFVCLFLAADPKWGSHVDNLHVRPDCRGLGLGRRLLAAAAELALAEAPGQGLDLHVYVANTAARGFYRRLGGTESLAEKEIAPDGSRQTYCRIWWPDPARLLAPA